MRRGTWPGERGRTAAPRFRPQESNEVAIDDVRKRVESMEGEIAEGSAALALAESRLSSAITKNAEELRALVQVRADDWSDVSHAAARVPAVGERRGAAGQPCRCVPPPCPHTARSLKRAARWRRRRRRGGGPRRPRRGVRGSGSRRRRQRGRGRWQGCGPS